MVPSSPPPPAAARGAAHVTPPHHGSPPYHGAASAEQQPAAANDAPLDARDAVRQPESGILHEHNYAVAISADQFVTQPIAVTIVSAAAAATGTHPLVQSDGRNFCTTCQSFTCDHAHELDFEWTAEDDAALIAGEDDDDDDQTSVPSSDEDELLASSDDEDSQT
jgi:hypothetical protein